VVLAVGGFRGRAFTASDWELKAVASLPAN
jgi:hypothetical protein